MPLAPPLDRPPLERPLLAPVLPAFPAGLLPPACAAAPPPDNWLKLTLIDLGVVEALQCKPDGRRKVHRIRREIGGCAAFDLELVVLLLAADVDSQLVAEELAQAGDSESAAEADDACDRSL